MLRRSLKPGRRAAAPAFAKFFKELRVVGGREGAGISRPVIVVAYGG
jgi:hypothetical protein